MPLARDDRARTVFNTPGLVVTGASAEDMLAMKIDTARNSDEGRHRRADRASLQSAGSSANVVEMIVKDRAPRVNAT